MARCIIKLNDGERDWYLEWGTIADAPTTYGMSRDELHLYIKNEYGAEGLRELPERLERLDKRGTSWGYDGTTLENTISGNRAGKNESCLTKEQLIYKFCHQKGEVEGHDCNPNDEDCFTCETCHPSKETK